MYVPDCPSLSPSQHIFTCRPYLMLFTEKFEIVSPFCKLMTVIFWPKAIVSLLSLMFLNVSQLPSVQNLKVCALVHCTLETSTWAKAADGNVNANKAKEMCRNNLFLIIGFNSNFNLRTEMLKVHPHLHQKTTILRLQRVSTSIVMVNGARWRCSTPYTGTISNLTFNLFSILADQRLSANAPFWVTDWITATGRGPGTASRG